MSLALATTIRTACITDARTIATIHIESWRHAYEGMLPADFLAALSLAQRTRQWHTALADQTGGTLVCETQGEMTGWTSFGPCRDPDRAVEGAYELYAIHVHPPRMRQGFGRQLMLATEYRCRVLAAETVSLWVLAVNASARAFYDSLGYAHDGSRESISIGGRPFEKYRYLKRMA